MKLYTAKVVSVNDDKSLGRIEVFIPKLMHLFMENSEEITQKNINNQFESNLDSKYNVKPFKGSVSSKNTIKAMPFFGALSKESGNFIVPDKGSIISVFFVNDDITQCHYFPYGRSFNNTKLDFGSLMESSDGDPNCKVLYKGRNATLLGFNEDKAKFFLQVNGSKISIDKNEIIITNTKGDIVKMDGNINVTTGGNVVVSGANIRLN